MNQSRFRKKIKPKKQKINLSITEWPYLIGQSETFYTHLYIGTVRRYQIQNNIVTKPF